MNTKPNFAHDIAEAEALGDTALLAAIARQLLAERIGLPPAPKVKPEPKPKADDAALLTLSERRALGLPPEKKPRFAKSAAYRHVLVTFGDGYRQLAGYYPRLPNPDDLTPAIASARGRLLTLLSGGRFNDPTKAKRLPKITSAQLLTDPQEIETERARCGRLRDAREAFTPGFNPLYASDIPSDTARKSIPQIQSEIRARRHAA